MGLLASVLSLLGCDAQKVAELEEGVSTEVDVRARFGEPEKVWDGPAGERVFEYSRQPQGHKNYMISIGADGRMAALRQVLHPDNFARVQPGMAMEDVRRMLGKPLKITPFALKQHTHFDWRYLDGPNTADSRIFSVVFDSASQRVLSTASMRDPALDPQHNN